jgi:hypothetical protein
VVTTKMHHQFTLCGACGKKGARRVRHTYRTVVGEWLPDRIKCRYCGTWEPLFPNYADRMERGSGGTIMRSEYREDIEAASRWRERAAAWKGER